MKVLTHFLPLSPVLLQELVRLLPGSHLGKLGLFQAPNLIELVVDAYKVQSTQLFPLKKITFFLIFLSYYPIVQQIISRQQ